MARGEIDPVDVHVGKVVRRRRATLKVSLAHVAAQIGVTVQQLQKYETGTNRISAGVLFKLAGALRVSEQDFFSGLAHRRVQTVGTDPFDMDFVSHRDGLRYAGATLDRRAAVDVLRTMLSEKHSASR